MQASDDTAPVIFSEEEKRKFSPILKLQKVDNAHFRRELKALSEKQARLLDYMNMKRPQGSDPTLQVQIL